MVGKNRQLTDVDRRTLLRAAGVAATGTLATGASPTATRAQTGSAGPPASWSRTYGGASSDAGHAAVRTSDGGFALAGSTASFGGSGFDGWLVGTDAEGREQWSRTFEEHGTDELESVVEVADGFVLGGNTRASGGARDGWLVRTDTEGALQWSRTYDAAGEDVVRDVVRTTDGGYAFVGQTGQFDGSDDLWLAKTDADGTLQWDRRLGGGDLDTGHALVPTPGGGVAACGVTESFGPGSFDAWLVAVDAGGAEVFRRTFGGSGDDFAHSLVRTGDGGYVVAGQTRSFGPGTSAFWLLGVDGDGREQWSRTYAGAGRDVAESVVSVSGGYAVAGHSLTDGDGWLLRTDATGRLQWSTTLGSDRPERVRSVVEAADGGLVVCGVTQPPDGQRFDAWLAKTGAANEPPTAAFDYEPRPATTGRPVTFDAAASSDPDGSVVGYEWAFDDGASATGAQPTHTYDGAGEQTVTLTVTDDAGATATAERAVLVHRRVSADVRGEGSDRINPDSDALVPVRIAGSGSFDPTADLAVDTLRFGAPDAVASGGGATPAGSGRAGDELSVRFRADAMGFEGSETTGHLVGETTDGVPVFGSARVVLRTPVSVPAPGPAGALAAVLAGAKLAARRWK